MALWGRFFTTHENCRRSQLGTVAATLINSLSTEIRYGRIIVAGLVNGGGLELAVFIGRSATL